MWEFDEIRSLAIREIERYPLSSVEKISLSKEFDIASIWTLKAYAEICERPEALTIQEALDLGLHTSICISQLREKLRRSSGRLRSPSPLIRNVSKPSESPFGDPRHIVRKEFVPANRRASHARNALDKSLRFSETLRLVSETFGLTGVSCAL